MESRQAAGREQYRSYLNVPEVAGSSELYYTFLANCMAANVTHRIIPLRTSSSTLVRCHTQPPAFLLDPCCSLFVAKSPPSKIPPISRVGAMAFLAHKLRPQLIYVDASHANPDVFIDYENFYTILAPGGALAVDDVATVPAVRKAFHALIEAIIEAKGLSPQFYDSMQARSINQAVVWKPLKE